MSLLLRSGIIVLDPRGLWCERDEKMGDEKMDYRVNIDELRHDWPLILLILLLVVASVLVYPHLPGRVPSHWNVHGQVDGYSSRSFAAFFMPLLTIWIYALLVLLPLIDPQRPNYALFAGAYRMLRGALVVLLSGIWTVTILVALGYSLDVQMIVRGAIGLLLLLFGFLMGQIRFNYFVGVRTPWTLADERVWEQTHLFTGRIWVLGGLLLLLGAGVPGDLGLVFYFGVLGMMILAPIIFSYIEYARINPR